MRKQSHKAHLLCNGVCVICDAASRGLSIQEIWEELDGLYLSVHAVKRHLEGQVRPQAQARQKAKILMAQGKMSDREIHRQTNVSRVTLHRWRKIATFAIDRSLKL